MIDLIIAICTVAGFALIGYHVLKPRERRRHRWHEIDSADVAHTHRIARRGR